MGLEPTRLAALDPKSSVSTNSTNLANINPKDGIVGWTMGFEPMTSGTTIQRSNLLSYAHHIGVASRASFAILRILLWKSQQLFGFKGVSPK